MPQTDLATRHILVANGVTLAVALWQGWGVVQLMWPFWIQSVIIGWYARQRMLKLSRFCTEGFRINNRAVDPTPATRRSTANFFALHYGLFHLVYLFFLMAMTGDASSGGTIQVTNSSTGVTSEVMVGSVHPLDFLIFAVLGVGFWRTHRASHAEHVAADLGGKPNIGTLMFMPYVRILPMHLAIIIGVAMGGMGAVWLFMLLKTGADVGMHKLEHRMLQRSGQT